MDPLEATSVVFKRIRETEPVNVTNKIVGYLLMQDHGEELIRLAFGPDSLLHSAIQKAKIQLGLVSPPVVSPPISPSPNAIPFPDRSSIRPFVPNLSPQGTRLPSPFLIPERHLILDSNRSPEDLSMQSPSGFLSLQEQIDPSNLLNSRAFLPLQEQIDPSNLLNSRGFLPLQEQIDPSNLLNSRGFLPLQEQIDHSNPLNSRAFLPLQEQIDPSNLLNSRAFLPRQQQIDPSNPLNARFLNGFCSPDTPFSRGPRSPSEFSIKTCHYFNKGFCKHGSSCRFFHVKPFLDKLSMMEEFDSDEKFLSPAVLHKLELEITELLKMKRGPVSIAMLPMLYYENYGRTLQAEGYLTESQRHGKAGYSLTKLIDRLKNSIKLIERPHGQHAMILVEDAHKYGDGRGDRNDPSAVVIGARQIYLTFPAESSFTEEDVSNYFSTFGLVQDVRIPCPQKRMFGFVTFADVDTVKKILSKGNPHYVCDARVLVKPYKEKPKLMERRYPDKHDPTMFYGSHYTNIDFNLQSSSLESSGFSRKPFMPEQELSLEAQIRQLTEMQLGRKSFRSHSLLGFSMDEHVAQEDHSNFPSEERISQLIELLNDSDTDNFVKQTEAIDDPESVEDNGDLPFAPSGTNNGPSPP